MMPDHVRKCLRQQSKDFYAAGFEALISQRTSVLMLMGDVLRNKCFSSFEYHMFYVSCPCITLWGEEKFIESYDGKTSREDTIRSKLR
jgi:hypothetical protein